MKSISLRLTALLLVALLLCGCTPATNASKEGTTLNGISLQDFTIIYDEKAPDYNQRAASFIQQEIKSRTGIELNVSTVSQNVNPHEIVVGETSRPISKKLDAQTEDVQFAIIADDNHIAMEGDYFIIAAAAYFFVNTYITGKTFDSSVPKEIRIHAPIQEDTKNVIFLIGDGMGPNHVLMPEYMVPSEDMTSHDNESIFYGKYLPYQGQLRTNSLDGTTDSAAGATALACGFKTHNGYIGKDENLNDVLSLTELANSKGMATAVMSTDQYNGATPAGFSAHANDRNDTKEILESQTTVEEKGTILLCGLDYSTAAETEITTVLDGLGQSENGFFIMYEEGHIDKHSHSNLPDETYGAVLRFNQAIGIFMEYAFYHPGTLVLITADHETGGLSFDQSGLPMFSSTNHTSANVPIYAYGKGAEVFEDYNEENNEVPKVIAKLWGEENFGG